jgi:septal ring factor EnvC (AmiA/AmiB activator)
MSRAQKALSVLVVACLGLWGCAEGAANGHANAERIRALETKIAKLEDDFRAVVVVREQLRKQLTAVEQERARLGQQVEELQAVVKERDQLRQQLAARTNERDALQSQFDLFRKGIKTLLGQSETPAAVITPTALSTTDG